MKVTAGFILFFFIIAALMGRPLPEIVVIIIIFLVLIQLLKWLKNQK